MGLLTIDQEKCNKDGICVSECPRVIIRMQEGDGYPEIIPGGEETCMLCGHCVAVCPHGALSHAKVPIEDCPPIEKELTVNIEQAAQFLRTRRSIRFYQDKPVEKAKIQRLIEIARYAPTGSNTQLVEWLVFTDKEKIKELAGLAVDWMREVLKKDPEAAGAPYVPLVVAGWDAGYDAVLRSAPALVVAIAPEEARNGLVDLTISLSYFELAAPSLGLGTCWAGLVQHPLLTYQPLKEAMGLPDGYPHHYPMMLGYPKFKYHRLPERKLPKITWR